MNHPDKWRETIDISTLPFRQIQLLEILGYPHAGNDVFHVRLLHRQCEMRAYIKVERQQGADIANEIDILSFIPLPFAPEVIESSVNAPCYLVTKERPGERLSTIIQKRPETGVKPYLHKQASLLSKIHRLQLNCAKVKDRKFFHVPSADFCAKYSLENIRSFLLSNTPTHETSCFIHGDFHYANMLWEHDEISCVLDYELSGWGLREFDMAWAIFLRPGQSFADSWEDVTAFLSGYPDDYSLSAFCYYYLQIAAHFFPLGDDGYRGKLKKLMEHVMSIVS